MSNNKPEIKIKGKIQDMAKKEKNIKPKQSNFLLTINTNQQYKDDDEHLDNDIEVFDSTIKDLLNNVEQYINLPETDKWDDHFIKDIDIDYVLERGQKKGQLHIHILFKIKHHTKIQLNYDKIKNKITTDLGLHNGYMQNKLLKMSTNDNIVDYLNKYV
jgi:hypothetical protein